jgi:hypothetical protein
MTDEDISDMHEVASVLSKQFALQSLHDLDLPETVKVIDKSFEILGPKIHGRIMSVINKLRDEHGENLPYLMAIALRESWFACCAGAWYTTLMINHSNLGRFESLHEEMTPEGYAEANGYAGSLVLSVNVPTECDEQVTLRRGTPYVKRPLEANLLHCMAIYWLSKATELLSEGQISDAMNWVFEGLEALNFAHSNYMFNEGEVMEREANQDARKELLSKAGKIGASKKHESTTQLKQWAIDQAMSMRGTDVGIAKKLFGIMPKKFDCVSKNPERMIYEALLKHHKELKPTRLAGHL